MNACMWRCQITTFRFLLFTIGFCHFSLDMYNDIIELPVGGSFYYTIAITTAGYRGVLANEWYMICLLFRTVGELPLGSQLHCRLQNTTFRFHLSIIHTEPAPHARLLHNPISCLSHAYLILCKSK